jgi:methionyl-tRNA formyltransferase
MTPADLRVVFMGSPSFAVPSLDAIVAAGYTVVAVVTQPDRPAGRGSALQMPESKVAALRHEIEVFQPESFKDAANVDRLRGYAPDLFVVAAYGKILPRAVLEIPTRGCVNVHASLLPRWRGASPVGAAILAGDRITGVSIMEMALKMDAGPVIWSASTEIGDSDTTGSLEARLATLGAETLISTLPRWLDGRLSAVPQDEALVTYCRPIAKHEGHLRTAMTAVQAERAIRAYNPWPVAHVLYGGERLAIWSASARAALSGDLPGTLRMVDKRLEIALADNTWLELHEVQRPGGRHITAQQFLSGERGKLEPKVGLA